MSTKKTNEQHFNQANIRRHELSDIPKSFQEMLYFMDYKIRKEIKSFTLLSSICGGDRSNFIVDPNFQRSFGSLSLEEKVNYYAKAVDYGLMVGAKDPHKFGLKRKQSAAEMQEKFGNGDIEKLKLEIKVFKGYRSWQETPIQINGFKVISRTRSSMNIDLRNYLLRRSKKKGQKCYVLEAIKSSDPESIRFAFTNDQSEQKHLPIIKERIDMALEISITKQITEIRKRKLEQSASLSNPSLIENSKNKKFKLKGENTEERGFMKNEMAQEEGYEEKQNNRGKNLMAMGSRISHNRTICEEIVKDKDEQYLDEQLSEIISKQNEQIQNLEAQMKKKEKKSHSKSQNTTEQPSFKNIFRILLPNYQLAEIGSLMHYGSVYQSQISQFYIYQNTNIHSSYKVQFVVDFPVEIACKAIYNMHLYKHWHPQIEQAHIKLKITSENSCLTYQQVKPFSEWYRERDFLVLIHLFREGSSYYIVGKSIENTNYIPLQSVKRANIDYIAWRVEQEPGSKNKSKIMMEVKIDYGGLLNKSHQMELAERYLRGFEFMNKYFSMEENQKKLYNSMGFYWVINENEEAVGNAHRARDLHRLNSLRTCDFESGSEIQEDDDLVFYSITDMNEMEGDPFGDGEDIIPNDIKIKRLRSQQDDQLGEESEHELDEEQIKAHMTHQDDKLLISQVFGEKQNIQVDEEGIILLPKSYLKKKFKMVPGDPQIRKVEIPYDNIVEKDDWVLEKNGGLKLINKVKIAAQNNVLGYVMKTLKKNLFSGKGVLNISLPVDIFNVDSNLQRVCEGLSLGPQFLEKAAQKNTLQRFKWSLAFGLSNSIIYFDVEKPFNPILGQTYQGYIRGCPVYAEQISHHPPITSILLYGRGYRVSACLQAKVNIHMNSGDGINQGLYSIIFDDGQTIKFQTPPGEVSGLAVGDRKFNLQGKGLYIDEGNQYYCEMKFVDDGGFFSKKKRNFNDQITGQIVKVSHNFITKFMSAPVDNKPSPKSSEIVESICQVTGRWPFDLKIDGEPYYNVRTMLPDKLLDETYPLNSNSNYREDLYYRKLQDLPKSQTHKQRLEVIQRGDRKLRQKFHGKAH